MSEAFTNSRELVFSIIGSFSGSVICSEWRGLVSTGAIQYCTGTIYNIHLFENKVKGKLAPVQKFAIRGLCARA